MKPNFSLKLRSLILFEWCDESGVKQQLKIVKAISGKWREVAALLGLTVSQMDGIQQQSFMDPEQCCLRVFDHWIISNGEFTDYPITWSGLHKLLLDVGLSALAEQLRAAVGLDIPMPVSIDEATEKASLV